MSRSFCLITLLLLGACASSDDEPRMETGPVTEHVATASDGVPISYGKRGSGETALVFIHGWACDRTFWREQAWVFADRYHVITIDLPGHGQSGGYRKHWSMERFGHDVKAVADAEGLDRMILVGHSMGGPISLMAAAAMPGRVLGVVGVDTLHNAEFQFPEGQLDQVIEGFKSDFERAMASGVEGMLPAEADPAVKTWITAKASAANRHAVIQVFRAFDDYHAGMAMRRAGVPIRCINSVPTTPYAMATEAETNRKYADFAVVMMQGTGHYPMLERPDEFNGHLASWIDELDVEAEE